MAVVSTPFLSRLRLINAEEDMVQTFSRINPELQAGDLQAVRQAVNSIRRAGQSATGGYYTIMDELTQA